MTQGSKLPPVAKIVGEGSEYEGYASNINTSGRWEWQVSCLFPHFGGELITWPYQDARGRWEMCSLAEKPLERRIGTLGGQLAIFVIVAHKEGISHSSLVPWQASPNNLQDRQIIKIGVIRESVLINSIHVVNIYNKQAYVLWLRIFAWLWMSHSTREDKLVYSIPANLIVYSDF